MDKDHDFNVRPGRIRTPRGRVTPGRAYANQVLKAANMARGGKAFGSGSGRSPSQFTGSRIGRGAGAGAVLGDANYVGARTSFVNNDFSHLGVGLHPLGETV